VTVASTTPNPHNTGRPAELIEAGEFDAALAECAARLALNPTDHAALYWQGVAASEQNQHPAAVAALQAAIGLDATQPDYHAQLGRSLIGMRQVSAACAAADAAFALEPDQARTLDMLGVIYSFAGRHAQAAEVLRRTVKLAPGNASYWFNLGASQKFNGDFDAAEAAYEMALQLDPAADKALAALAHLRKQKPKANHIKRFRTRLRDYSGNIQDEMRLSFGLAKELDDIGEYAEAFALLTDVSERWRSGIRYSIKDDEHMFSALQQGFTTGAIQRAAAGSDSPEPIFIVGMPRTGTTLTERIISSHSDVFAAGELNQFGTLIRVAAQARANPDFDTQRIQRVLGSDLRQLGDRYVANTRPATGHTPRFIDKMPLNFLYAGFIALALPHARIICVRRNPLDTCLSNFRQLFSLRSAYYAYSYDLLDCGRYYVMFDRLLQQWNELFPGRILNLQYEALVADQEVQSRRLIEHCGLDWQDACLNFQDNAAPVATASSAQVREPIYTSAVARWKNYTAELAPLIELLTANGIALD
jgi:tetratricopeptide (TPR) repeat protein